MKRLHWIILNFLTRFSLLLGVLTPLPPPCRNQTKATAPLIHFGAQFMWRVEINEGIDHSAKRRLIANKAPQRFVTNWEWN
jgi:hypothetical protein